MSLFSFVKQLRGPACVALAADIRSRQAAFLFPQRNASGLSFPNEDRRSAAQIKASAIRATTDMKQQGRDAQQVSGHKTDAIVNRVYDRRRVGRGPAVKRSWNILDGRHFALLNQFGVAHEIRTHDNRNHNPGAFLCNSVA
ncbi:MAG TPA: hypothetical protein VG425_04410 [Casimicrobiaceae bacterium]|nr:hypothetical protein [Casimicrobiaceae bacterium]